MPSSSAIRAGRAFVELFADEKPLVRGLNAAKAKLNSFGSAVAKIGAGLTGAGLAIAGPLLASAKAFADVGSDLADMSGRTGIAVEQLSALKFAADQSGTSMEGLEKGVRKMQRTIIDAATGTESAREAFDLLGINLDEIRKLSPDEQFLRIGDALAGVANPTTKAALAMEIFGRSGAELLPLFAGGAQGVRELMAEAERLGLVMSTEDAVAAEAFGDMLQKAQATIARLVVSIGSALGPALSNLAELFSVGNASLGEWIRQNGDVVRLAALTAAGLIAAGAALTALGVAIKVVAAGFGLAATAITATAAVLGTLLTPIGAITAALVAGIAAWLTYSNSGQAALAALGEFFGQLKTDALATIQGIADALAAGDIALAGEVAMAGLQVAFLTAKKAIVGTWTTIRDTLIGVWQELGATLHRIWVVVMNGLVRITARVGDGIKGFFENAAADTLAFLGIISDAEAEQAKGTLAERRAAELAALDQQFDPSAELLAIDEALRDAARARAEGTAQEIKAAEAALEEARRKLIDATQRAAQARASADQAAQAQGVAVQPVDIGDIEEKLGNVADKMVAAQEQFPEAMALGSKEASERILKSIAFNAQNQDSRAYIEAGKNAIAELKKINGKLENAPLLAASTI